MHVRTLYTRGRGLKEQQASVTFREDDDDGAPCIAVPDDETDATFTMKRRPTSKSTSSSRQLRSQPLDIEMISGSIQASRRKRGPSADDGNSDVRIRAKLNHSDSGGNGVEGGQDDGVWRIQWQAIHTYNKQDQSLIITLSVARKGKGKGLPPKSIRDLEYPAPFNLNIPTVPITPEVSASLNAVVAAEANRLCFGSPVDHFGSSDTILSPGGLDMKKTPLYLAVVSHLGLAAVKPRLLHMWPRPVDSEDVEELDLDQQWLRTTRVTMQIKYADAVGSTRPTLHPGRLDPDYFYSAEQAARILAPLDTEARLPAVIHNAITAASLDDVPEALMPLRQVVLIFAKAQADSLNDKRHTGPNALDIYREQLAPEFNKPSTLVANVWSDGTRVRCALSSVAWPKVGNNYERAVSATLADVTQGEKLVTALQSLTSLDGEAISFEDALDMARALMAPFAVPASLSGQYLPRPPSQPPMTTYLRQLVASAVRQPTTVLRRASIADAHALADQLAAELEQVGDHYEIRSALSGKVIAEPHATEYKVGIFETPSVDHVIQIVPLLVSKSAVTWTFTKAVNLRWLSWHENQVKFRYPDWLFRLCIDLIRCLAVHPPFVTTTSPMLPVLVVIVQVLVHGYRLHGIPCPGWERLQMSLREWVCARQVDEALRHTLCLRFTIDPPRLRDYLSEPLTAAELEHCCLADDARRAEMQEFQVRPGRHLEMSAVTPMVRQLALRLHLVSTLVNREVAQQYHGITYQESEGVIALTVDPKDAGAFRTALLLVSRTYSSYDLSSADPAIVLLATKAFANTIYRHAQAAFGEGRAVKYAGQIAVYTSVQFLGVPCVLWPSKHALLGSFARGNHLLDYGDAFEGVESFEGLTLANWRAELSNFTIEPWMVNCIDGEGSDEQVTANVRAFRDSVCGLAFPISPAFDGSPERPAQLAKLVDMLKTPGFLRTAQSVEDNAPWLDLGIFG